MGKKIIIIGSIKLPIPAVKGGAVPNLIEELIIQQEKEKKLDLTICSLWDEKAQEEARKYGNTDFIWAKVPRMIASIDNLIRWFLKNVIRKDRVLSLGFLAQMVWYTFFVSKVISKQPFDLIVYENSVQMLSSLKFWNNKKRYNGKYYIHMHSVPRKYSGAKKEFEDSKGIICISEYVANEIIADTRTRVEPSQIRIMYNCINTDLFCPQSDTKIISEIKNKYSIPENKRLIVFAGRLCKDKGIEEVLKAVRLLNRRDTILVIVGSNFYNSGIESPYEEHLSRMAEEIKEKIIFTGYVDYKYMPKIYAMADIVVLPSMWEEPAGMTILEGMACGKAVITTQSGGIPEYVGIENCVLLSRDDQLIDNMKLEITRLLDNDRYKSNYEERAQLHAHKYNLEYYYKQFLNIIGESHE